MVFALLFSGCKKDSPSTGDTSQNPQATPVGSNSIIRPVSSQQPTQFVSTPVLQPILTVWQEGHTAQAVDRFIHANWNARPLFPSGMAVGLTDAQFKALPDSQRQLRNDEMMSQLELLKQLASAVDSSAQDALSKGDNTRARQCYESLKQFGAALNDPKSQQLLQMVGQVSMHMAEQGLNRIKL